MKSIRDLRTDYQKSELNVEDLTLEPITLFQQWLSQAITYSNDANATSGTRFGAKPND